MKGSQFSRLNNFCLGALNMWKNMWKNIVGAQHCDVYKLPFDLINIFDFLIKGLS